jgi:spermidine synthase
MVQDIQLNERESGIEVGALLTSIFIIAICGLIYELLVGTLSSYLMGDSVFQFSLTLGFYLSAMGIGSFLSRAVKEDLLKTFLIVEIVIALIGGASAAWLFGAYTLFRRSYVIVMIATLVVLGTLIGLEIPLLTRIARRYGTLRDTLANVLAFDYLGALAASLLFPLILLPYLGLIKTSFLVGVFNLLVVGINLRVFGAQQNLPQSRAILLATIGALALLAAGFLQSAQVMSLFDQRLYQDQIIFEEQSRYQRIVVTTYQEDLRLFLDNELQFSSRDEYRYHESLVHPAMSLAPSREHVLVIGGGDGLVLREVWKYPDVKQVTLVDIDPAMTRLGQTFDPIVRLNDNSMNDPRLRIVNEDGYKFLEDNRDMYQVIIADLPDPRNEGLAKLYSQEFYGIVKRHLARGGVFVTQSSSPYYVRQAYWCVARTVSSTGLNVQTYHAYVPSFGDWGFVLASDLNVNWNDLKLRAPVRFLTNELLQVMTQFDPDLAEVPAGVSTLENPIVLRYYIEGWRRWRS